MNNRRKLFIALGAGALAAPFASRAQAKVPTVGLLWIEPMPYRKVLLDALREKGYVENQTIRFMDLTVRDGYAQITDNARELVRAKVDLIVTYGGSSTIGVTKATKELPIVMFSGLDPVALGWAVSLAHPGGNVTGISTINSELTGKRIELLKELLPKLSRIGVLTSPESSGSVSIMHEIEIATRLVKLQTQIAEVRIPADIERAFAELSRARVGALIVMQSTMLAGQAERIVALAAKHRLPAVYPTSPYTDAGGLISYNANRAEQVRKMATYIDRILKGARAGDLPIEQPTKFELVLNMKTAKALGIKIPNTILVRADKVIE